jgi:hypothetical protein
MEELKTKIKELGKQAAALSRQAGEIPSQPAYNRKRKLDLMRQARDTSKQCQVLIQELKQHSTA